MFVRVVLTASAVLVLAFAPAAALPALADESPIPSFRPPMGVLRPVGVPTASVSPAAALAMPTRVPASAAPASKELVIFVGGYQSCSCDDHGFDDYAKRFGAAGYDVKHFGADPAFPYDTYGHIDASALILRDEIRTLSKEYSAIHIVSHSMGGVVADRAFAYGLSSADHVVTYVSLAGPHNGSDTARELRVAQSAGRQELLHRVAALVGNETESAAIDDLARATAVPAPAGVVRLDLREATDLWVTARDAADRGVPSRLLLGAVEGHGGILHDSSAIDLTLGTVATRRVPRDDRSFLLTSAAAVVSDHVGFIVACVALAICGALVVARKQRVAGLVQDVLATRLPPAVRKPCP